MEFIGISGKENKVDLNGIINIASSLGLDMIKNNWDYDSEVSVGLKYFTNRVKDDFLIQLILKNKKGQQTTTSNFLTEELNAFYTNSSKSNFIQFIQNLKEAHVAMKGMHIIFSSEWEDITQNIRYIKATIDDIDSYFKVNNGWHLIFYSLKTQSYMYDFGCPLIFEIQS